MADLRPDGRSPFARRLRRGVIGSVLFVLVVAAGTVAFLVYGSYGEGYRVGTIQKLSKKGVLFKTWEGELSQGFLESAPDAANGVATRIWYFTVEPNDEVLKRMDHAIETNRKVKLFYHEKYRILPWLGDTRQLVYRVEEVQ